MKRLKKLICVLLCLVMAATITAMPAAGYDEELARKNDLANMLEELIERTQTKYPMLGDHDTAIYTGETMSKLEEQDSIAYELVWGDPGWVYAPLEELEQAYSDFLAAYEGLQVYIGALQDLYSKVKDESNEAHNFSERYYPETMWRSFCAARQTAKDVLAAESPSDDTVTGAYFALRSAFNDLCKSNQIIGDIDHNGKVDVGDVLYLQKYLAGLVPLNSSQKFVASVSIFTVGTVNTNNILIIQKYLVECEEKLKGYDLWNLIDIDKNPLIDKGWIL